MWPLLVLIIPICGYMYVESDNYLKYKLKKSDGWHAYFLVSVHGMFLLTMLAIDLIRMLLSMFLIGIFGSLLMGIDGGISEITKTDELFFIEGASIIIESIYSAVFIDYLKIVLGSIEYIFRSITANRFSAVLIAVLIIYTVSKCALLQKEQRTDQAIQDARDKIAKDSNIDEMIFQSEKLGLLLMITLKSRKVYVGQIIGREIGYTDLKEISLIPILSGYRDKDTLLFNVSHDYSGYYAKENITESSVPSLSSFKQTVFFDQIESISLFDSETYRKFQKNKDGSNEKLWKKFLNKDS